MKNRFQNIIIIIRRDPLNGGMLLFDHPHLFERNYMVSTVFLRFSSRELSPFYGSTFHIAEHGKDELYEAQVWVDSTPPRPVRSATGTILNTFLLLSSSYRGCDTACIKKQQTYVCLLPHAHKSISDWLLLGFDFKRANNNQSETPISAVSTYHTSDHCFLCHIIGYANSGYPLLFT